METAKIAALLSLLGAAYGVGLAFAWGAIAGTPVARDEIVRIVLISTVVCTSAIVVTRRRSSPRA